MNILFINQSTPNTKFGGVQCVSFYLYKYFKQRGHNVTLLTWSKCGADEFDSNQDCIYTPDPLPADITPANAKFIEELIGKTQYDIVMNHTCLGPNFAHVVKFLKLRNLQIVSVVHSSLFGVYGLRISMQNFGNKHIRRFLDWGIKSLFYVKYHRQWSMVSKYSDRVSMLSDKFIPEYQYFAGKKYPEKMTYMPNPLTIDDEPRVDKENHLVFVGRLSIEKGLHYLLDIWKLLEEKYPDWQLDIVGDGSERAFVENRIKELGLQRCTMHGFQKAEPYYNRAKIFCMTSIFEGFGLVLIEAMHFGTVPLAFRSYANVGDIIENGKSGLLIPPFDVEQYANMLSLLMDNPLLLETMAKQAERKSREYAVETIGAKWERMFEEVIKEKK